MWSSGSAARTQSTTTTTSFPTTPTAHPTTTGCATPTQLCVTPPVNPGADVLLVRLHTDSSADVSAGTLAELPEYLTETPLTLYWLTFDTGTIVAICEQYSP